MKAVRDFVNRSPWLGWALAAAILVVAAVMYWRLSPARAAYSLDRMTENVTVRCTETGNEWTMPRGRMEKELFGRPGPIDPGVGLVNPDTGKPTGFPVDDWKSTVDRINKEKQALADRNKPRGGAPK
jgi:hypothetical protein